MDTPCNAGNLMKPPKNRVCGARTRAGTPCKNWSMQHRARCRMHGGKSPRGIGSPTFRHGRYSRDFVGHLLWEFGLTTDGTPTPREVRRERALRDAIERWGTRGPTVAPKSKATP